MQSRMLLRCFPVLLAALGAACGGATEVNGDGTAGDGSGGTAGGGSGGVGPTTAGGTTASATSGGGNTSAATGTSSSASSTTSPNCIGLDCAAIECPDGRSEVPPGECCPVCVCSDVVCASPDCPNGRIETPPGYCCPQCIEELCDGVTCTPPIDCGEGRTFTRPDGACCSGCLPDEPGSVGCVDIACPGDDACAKGFLRGDLLGGCCYECLPDPLYCEQDADCVIADRPRSCCGCPEIMSERALDDDACWTPVADPRPIPEECYPEVTCDRECDACPEPGGAWCLGNRCMEVAIE